MSILLCIYLFIYCPLIIWTYYKLIKKFSQPKYMKEVPEKFKPFTRNDFKNWNQIEIYLGALFIFPIRAIGAIFSALTFYFLLQLCALAWGVNKPWPKRFYLASPILKFFARSYVFFSGFYWVPRKIVKYSDYDPTYVQSEADRLGAPSIVVSNHVSWYDTFTYVFVLLASYLSKDSVARYPIFGPITTNLKTIYVKRGDISSTQAAEQAIKDRIQKIKQGELYPPIIIFPEGTISNGQYLLSFKKGAFENLEPIKICCLKYHSRRFHPHMSAIGLVEVLLISLVQWKNCLEVYEFEGQYNPKHLNLEQYPQEQRWEIYAERVKDIMAKCLGIQKTKSGYRDSHEYETEYLHGKQKQN